MTTKEKRQFFTFYLKVKENALRLEREAKENDATWTSDISKRFKDISDELLKASGKQFI